MISTMWDTKSVSDADVWADFSDHAEDTWSDAEDESACDFGLDATPFTHLGYGYWTCPECEKMHEA
jgi:hypothetical protein